MTLQNVNNLSAAEFKRLVRHATEKGYTYLKYNYNGTQITIKLSKKSVKKTKKRKSKSSRKSKKRSSRRSRK